jgi:hypothetical protein
LNLADEMKDLPKRAAFAVCYFRNAESSHNYSFPCSFYQRDALKAFVGIAFHLHGSAHSWHAAQIGKTTRLFGCRRSSRTREATKGQLQENRYIFMKHEEERENAKQPRSHRRHQVCSKRSQISVWHD